MKQDTLDSIAALYEDAKNSLTYGTSDDIEAYLGMTLDTFDDLYPMFANDTDEVKESIIAKVKQEFLFVMMLSTAVQAAYVGQYRRTSENGDVEDLDAFDIPGVLGYYSALQAAGIIEAK